MIEYERTFLAKELPSDLISCEKQEIVDIYLPKTAEHPILRLRKKEDKYEITKKYPFRGTDSSKQIEETIQLSAGEFRSLRKTQGKEIRKFRYSYPFEDLMAEFDIFQDKLAGLVLIDFEFQNEQKMDAFEIPEFCVADVTQKKFIAGGVLCGKSYDDIAAELGKFGYAKLQMPKTFTNR